ncbi:SGNH hydrolase domain-containing protein [Rheinheimera sp. WS51]|uniref:SGNH hydrolase domain-containing protein n=1 Tax=Rheinheimera sp. WS51 TaxID=3425886 RepID=UPI003D8BF98B
MAELDNKLRINYGLSKACDNKFTLSKECRTSEQPEIAVWGDSYAMPLSQAIIAANPSVAMIQLTKSACGPILGLAPFNVRDYNQEWARQCLNFNQQVFSYLKQSSSIKYVVLSSSLLQYTSSNWQFLTENNIEKEDPELVLKYFKNTISQLKAIGLLPVIVSPPPRNGEDLGRCAIKTYFYVEATTACDFHLSENNKLHAKINSLLRKLEADTSIIWLDAFICPKQHCQVINGATLLYRDQGHLSVEGAQYIGKKYKLYQLLKSSAAAI